MAVFQQTNRDGVLENAQRQSVDVVVDSTLEGAALAPKALCVNDAGPGLTRDHINPSHPKQNQCHCSNGHILLNIKNLLAQALCVHHCLKTTLEPG